MTTQPTCAVATAVITVTAPTGAGFEYSVDGTNYQAGTTFTVAAGASYNVTVRSTTDNTCVSNATVVPVIAQPTAPVAPTASVTTQPTCRLLLLL